MDDTTYRTHRRFDRAARLLGEDAMRRLAGARVMVVGLGGVGSFAAEALARTGVGHLTLVDFDLVCVTNTNRQLHAMRGNIGKPKAEVLAERLRLVHPTATVDARVEFYGAETAEALLAPRPDYVIDAIDNLTAKAHLVDRCRRSDIPVVTSMGAAAKLAVDRGHDIRLWTLLIDPAEEAALLRSIAWLGHSATARVGNLASTTARSCTKLAGSEAPN